MKTPRDHFSEQAKSYRQFRPTYEPALFDWLARIAPSRERAWDCGCGSGQASTDLAARFDQVIATDSSRQQLALAESRPNLEYRCEPAERTSLPDRSIDLTLVAQALHWFDHDAFYNEVRRVSKPNAVVVAVSYNLLRVAPEIDALIDRLYYKVLGGYWPAERKHVEDGYQSIPFPFRRIDAPSALLTATWDLHQLLGYFESWSALSHYRTANGINPLDAMEADFKAAWGQADIAKSIAWPLTILAGVSGQALSEE